MLDSKDRKIIKELWMNARQTNSSLAKKAGLSREVVDYRVKKLEERDMIQGFMTLVDSGLLGYTTFNVFLRLKDFQQSNEITQKIRKDTHVKWLITLSGRYDLFFVMIEKNRKGFDRRLNRILQDYQHNIARYHVLNSVEMIKDVSTLNLSAEALESFHYEESFEPWDADVRIDVLDYEILRAISRNCRLTTVEIAKKIGEKITPAAVSYRIKKLESQRVIRGYRPILNLNRMGYLWYLLLFNLNSIPDDLRNRLKGSLKQNTNIIYADKTLGEWNLRLELLVGDHEEFHQELLDLRHMLSRYMDDYELMVVFEDHNMISFTEGMYKDAIRDNKRFT